MQWILNNPDLTIGVASAFVAVISAFIVRAETRQQRRVQQASVRVEIDHQSLDWGRGVIDALADAGAFAESSAMLTEQAFRSEQSALAARLSSLADQGRLFFPNYKYDDRGKEKESAFQGHRPAILYAIIYAFYEVKRLQPGAMRTADVSADFLFRCRRLFVSELQAFLDPQQRNELVERMEHLPEARRMTALDTAARLGIELDCRYPGLLADYKDHGALERVPAEERKAILRDVQRRLAE